MTAVDSIFAHAQATPGKTAVIVNGRGIDYASFARRIAAVRGFLHAQGVSRDRVAVLCIHNTLNAWIVGLALRSLGVTTVHGRSVGDFEKLGLPMVTAVLAPEEPWSGLVEAAAKIEAPLMMLPASFADSFAAGDLAPPTLGGPRGGHILLTSGTTGIYKKVLIDAAIELRAMKQRRDIYGLNAQSVASVFDLGGWTSVGYNVPISVWNLGATAVLHMGRDRSLSLAEPGLTLACTQPALLAMLLDSAPESMQRNDAMTLMMTAGAMPAGLWRQARERLTRDVRTCLGSTETGPVTFTRIESEADLAWHHIHPGFEVQVIDDQGRLLPPGQTGLVRVATTGVGGYLGDAEASRAFFQDGYFYPGDLGVMREDGRVSMLGRVTDVINVDGNKIATSPLESALQDRLGAAAVCVFSMPGEAGEIVHVAVQPGGPVSPADLRDALAAVLSGISSVRVHTVRPMPRNHMGKIDRSALRTQLFPDDQDADRKH